MMVENVILMCGFVSIWLSHWVPLIFIGRFLTGYANGSNKSSILPYTSEICQPRLRKFTGTLFVTSYTTGYAFMYIFGAFLHWRQISAILATWPLISFILLFLCPESPSWLLTKNRDEDAYNALFKVRGDKNVVEKEMMRMRENIRMQKECKTSPKSSKSLLSNLGISRFFKGTFIRPFVVLVVMTSLGLNLTGAPTIGFYLIQILKRSEVSIDPYVAAAYLVSWRLIITVATSIFLAPFIARRKLYIVSGIVLATGALMLGTVCYVEKLPVWQTTLESYPVFRWLPIVSIGLLYTGLSGGYCMITFAVLGELLPSDARGLGTGVVIGINVVNFFLIVKFTPTLIDWIDLNGLFWIYGGIGFSLVIFVYFCLPETFGKTLEDIEKHYRTLCYGTKDFKSADAETSCDTNSKSKNVRRPSTTDIYLNISTASDKITQDEAEYKSWSINARRASVMSIDL